MILMTGSNLAPILIPIAVMFGLVAWIVMVFHAASHPFWRDRTASAPRAALPRQSRPASPRSAHRRHGARTMRRIPVSAAHR
jgi:hypothetical protein